MHIPEEQKAKGLYRGELVLGRYVEIALEGKETEGPPSGGDSFYKGWVFRGRGHVLCDWRKGGVGEGAAR